MQKIMAELKKLMDKAKQYAIDGKWDEIDTDIVPNIIKTYNHSEIADELMYLTTDENNDVRDLAFTITAQLEMDDIPKEKQLKIKYAIRKGLDDNHVYAQFRAAVAAVKHSMYEPNDIKKIREILDKRCKEEEDETIRKIALEYLRKLENKK
jgi:HEAT repeat protein